MVPGVAAGFHVSVSVSGAGAADASGAGSRPGRDARSRQEIACEDEARRQPARVRHVAPSSRCQALRR